MRVLLPEEQQLLRRLAVFAGSFSVKSALAVALLNDVEQVNVGDHLADLVGKSLLVSDVEQGMRSGIHVLPCARQIS